MHSSREAFSSLQTQQGWGRMCVSLSSTSVALSYRIWGMRARGTKRSYCGGKRGYWHCACGHGREYTFTAAAAVPGGFRSEAMFVAVVGAGEVIRVCGFA